MNQSAPPLLLMDGSLAFSQMNQLWKHSIKPKCLMAFWPLLCRQLPYYYHSDFICIKQMALLLIGVSFNLRPV